MCSVLEFLYNHTVDCSGFVSWIGAPRRDEGQSSRANTLLVLPSIYIYGGVPLMYSAIKQRCSRGWRRCAPCNHTWMLLSSLF